MSTRNEKKGTGVINKVLVREQRFADAPRMLGTSCASLSRVNENVLGTHDLLQTPLGRRQAGRLYGTSSAPGYNMKCEWL